MFILVEESPHSTHPKSLAPEKGLNDMGALLEKNRALKLLVNMVNLTWDVAVKICFRENGLRLQSYKKSDTEQARAYPFVIQQISISLISVFPTMVAIIERIERHYWIAIFLNNFKKHVVWICSFQTHSDTFFRQTQKNRNGTKVAGMLKLLQVLLNIVLDLSLVSFPIHTTIEPANEIDGYTWNWAPNCPASPFQSNIWPP